MTICASFTAENAASAAARCPPLPPPRTAAEHCLPARGARALRQAGTGRTSKQAYPACRHAWDTFTAFRIWRAP